MRQGQEAGGNGGVGGWVWQLEEEKKKCRKEEEDDEVQKREREN